MKRSKYLDNQKKSNKGKFIFGGIVVVIILVVIYFLVSGNNTSESSKDEPEQTSEPKTEEPSEGEENVQEDPKENVENPSVSTEEPKGNAVPNEGVTNGGYIEGQSLPTEPTYVNNVLIANKKYPLPRDFDPGEDPTARTAFDQMAQDARTAGFEIVAFSTYRSYEYQETIYNNYVSRDGKENADRYSARPGYSEHQTGLAFDIGEKDKKDLWLTEQFGETPAGKWLADNAHKYGFILRYPKGKEAITGYMYESWHFRYLGVDLATEVKASNLTLEEYLKIQ
ncbi:MULTISPECIES: D-alanyl-D-alanine carboxypeptidase family protein [Lysinibacillus]|uniref:D-alanyl-D-alanine carboxypeptidase family protein n=1 Tax=Lysinibacillus antri TaxID=2498145 RepID=A0A3S0R6S4_9BACI|nr:MULTISPECIES: M15 family metallopeptidase [Lysinibacillus]RUL53650.1 D-alanyl-D-alanine carboxypeptidase family protein [Lysinibacillus antri]TSI06469.1 M15 family metallopeptidase [Lysinibacillus sp. BW-2-10]